MGEQVPPQPDDVIAWVTVRLHANGMLSVGGTISPPKMALDMLEHAKDAIRRQVKDKSEIVVPSRDVVVAPHAELREMGDLGPGERGDP